MEEVQFKCSCWFLLWQVLMLNMMKIREVIALHLSQIPEKLFYTYSIGGGNVD